MKFGVNGLILITLCIIVLQSCERISDSERNKSLILQYYEAINLGRTDFADKLVSETFVKINNNVKSEKFGPALFVESVEKHKENNIDYIFTIEDILAEGSKVSVRWSWKSTNIQYGKPTEIISQGISIFEIVEGKIDKLWQGFDILGFNKQLGFKFKAPDSTETLSE